MKPAPVKETISFEVFEKLDIRVGTIISVSDVKKSNKLMKLSVDFGDHVRSILAGTLATCMTGAAVGIVG